VTRVGVISDTHGLLRPEALSALAGSELIVHAGDVCDLAILERLAAIAPVHAVRGNMDRGAGLGTLPLTDVVEVESSLLYVLHILDELDLDPAAAGFGVVIYGHSHRPEIERRSGVLYLNPGSAGPRRFDLPVTLARLEVDGDACHATIVKLLDDGPGNAPPAGSGKRAR
jgi:putative phosphoesterase